MPRESTQHLINMLMVSYWCKNCVKTTTFIWNGHAGENAFKKWREYACHKCGHVVVAVYDKEQSS